MEKNMEEENLFGEMKAHIKVIFNKTTSMEKENITGKMVEFMMEIG